MNKMVLNFYRDTSTNAHTNTWRLLVVVVCIDCIRTLHQARTCHSPMSVSTRASISNPKSALRDINNRNIKHNPPILAARGLMFMGFEPSAGGGAGVDGLGADIRSGMAEIWSGVTFMAPTLPTSSPMTDLFPRAEPGRNASPITPPKSRPMSTPYAANSSLARAVTMRP